MKKIVKMNMILLNDILKYLMNYTNIRNTIPYYNVI